MLTLSGLSPKGEVEWLFALPPKMVGDSDSNESDSTDGDTNSRDKTDSAQIMVTQLTMT